MTTKGPVVAVVDDDKDIAEGLAEMLWNEGFAAVAFTSSISAWEAVQREPKRFGLLLLDVKMPGLDGRGFLMLMQKHRIRIPVILQTAAVTICDELAKEFGIFCLQKPFDLDALVDIVRNCFNNPTCLIKALRETEPASL